MQREKSADLFVRRRWQSIFQILHEETREQKQKETISYRYFPPLSITHGHFTLLTCIPEQRPAPSFLQDLTLFLPAMGGISPYMSVTWQQPVEIGLRTYSFLEKTYMMPKSIFYVKIKRFFFSFENTNLCDHFLLVHRFNRGFHPSEFSKLIIIFTLGLSMSTNLVVR